MLFCRQLYALVRSGVPLIRGLRQLSESSRHQGFAQTIAQIITDLEAGRDFGGACARHPRVFSPLFLSMIRVGEVSGRLDEAIQRLYEYLDREAQAIGAIKAALRYPTMVVGALVIAIFIIMTSVIPRLVLIGTSPRTR